MGMRITVPFEEWNDFDFGSWVKASYVQGKHVATRESFASYVLRIITRWIGRQVMSGMTTFSQVLTRSGADIDE